MVVADLQTGTFLDNASVCKSIASKHPYKEWTQKALRSLKDLGESSFKVEPSMDAANLLRMQAAIGMGAEDAQMVLESMAQTGIEPTYCMGDDIPLAVLSDKPHMLYNYFKQRFAQVSLVSRRFHSHNL